MKQPRKTHLTSGATYWIGKRLPLLISCEFSYDVRDPFAVTLILDSEGEQPVRWVFSRELLADGLRDSAGEGDVTVWPDEGGVEGRFLWLEVGRDPHTALFELPAEPVTEWLAGTYGLVPEGQETAPVEWNGLTHLVE
ncbi:SsgA family sporulation/cell division regulator [Streptomyces olivaceoviridis]